MNILQPLDIILLEGKWHNPINLGIMAVSKSKYTHCIIVKDIDGNIYDADKGGIQSRNISFYVGRKGLVLRHKLIDEVDIQDRLDWLKQTQNTCTGYDYLSWLGFLFHNGSLELEFFEDETRWYCSELGYWLWQYYKDERMHLSIEDKIFVYPYELICDKMHIIYNGKIM